MSYSRRRREYRPEPEETDPRVSPPDGMRKPTDREQEWATTLRLRRWLRLIGAQWMIWDPTGPGWVKCDAWGRRNGRWFYDPETDLDAMEPQPPGRTIRPKREPT